MGKLRALDVYCFVSQFLRAASVYTSTKHSFGECNPGTRTHTQKGTLGFRLEGVFCMSGYGQHFNGATGRLDDAALPCADDDYSI